MIICAFILAASLVSCKKGAEKKEEEKTQQNTVENGAFDKAEASALIKDIWEVPYSYDLSSYINVSRDDYVGISYPKATYEVTDEEVEEEIQSFVKQFATYSEVVNTPAENGDIVNIDYKGFMDGEEMDNASEEGAEFELGNAGYIPGFQEGIVGHTAGESFTVDATFPEDYGVEELNGRTAQFEMVLNKLKRPVYPELTDAFIAENTDYNTVEEYYSYVKEMLIAEKTSTAKVERKNNVFAKVLENVEIIEYPETEYNKYYNDFVSEYENQATTYGTDLETMLGEMGSTLEEFYSYADMYAKSYVETELVFFAIAKEEKILDALTKADYNRYLNAIAADYIEAGYCKSVEDFESQMGRDILLINLVYDNVTDFIIANGTEE